jgi:deoxyribodipyrimidine photo-lyase
MSTKVNFFWFRRDLRLEDNTALHHALNSGQKVIPVFIFDEEILDKLPKNDARVSFIYDKLSEINQELSKYGSGVLIKKGNPVEVWKELTKEFLIQEVFLNKDYEPYAITRDNAVKELLQEKGVKVNSFKDQVIFEENDVLKDDGKPYTVFTPFKKKWLKKFDKVNDVKECEILSLADNFSKVKAEFPSLESIGFEKSDITVKPYNFSFLDNYDKTRDYPFKDTTSYLSPHLRFGTVSIRKIVKTALETNQTFLSELIWREFFMQILFHFPNVVTKSFRAKYDVIPWENDKNKFEKWCKGETGYPLVDAGMRQLNSTGYMHNRVRMVVASFLCKHLLIDWRWGEAYFAEKLLDYDLSANNGNWQWAAGTGCDAAPYFRVFNPTEQLKKFDKDLIYTKTWVKDLDELTYPTPIVEHKQAREKAIKTYKEAISSFSG